jgi:hypothetical protein
MAHAHSMLDTSGYRHALRIRNAYYFSTLTMVARMCHNFTLYLQCLSCVLLHKPTLALRVKILEYVKFVFRFSVELLS